MDTMRSLNTSLPGTTPIKQPDPPEQLLAAFKAAALSVTNLYKSAASNQGEARLEGYQNAIDELLNFLDKENIGLNDGEGWRIRRWATERLDGRDMTSHNTESDDEADKTDRGSSPVCPRANNLTRISPPASNNRRILSPIRRDPTPPSIVSANEENITTIPTPLTAFTFQASYPYPQDADIVLADLESEGSRTSNTDSSILPHASLQASGITLPRLPRARSNHPARHGSKAAGSLGKGVGQKRKINYGDFFDIGNGGYGRDNLGGGGKRGRFA
ncbi:hypothetical protein GcM1_237074 [Golovinomyces cichoracearum]|uniref:Uncharacterized protein n=1 Tax=Golovinomyces cichoracearum TaxID=62708 RepID=A0A420IK12_9PEZI|nr:hypothetical protein GcM1_237074 [Golovinomyces cichoracearum]